METALSGRTWSIGGIEGESRCQAFLVLHGEGTFASDSGTIIELSAPFMLWLPRLARAPIYMMRAAAARVHPAETGP